MTMFDDYLGPDARTVTFAGKIVRKECSGWTLIELDDGRRICQFDSGQYIHPTVKEHCVVGAQVRGRARLQEDANKLGEVLQMWPIEHRLVTWLKGLFPHLTLYQDRPT